MDPKLDDMLRPTVKISLYDQILNQIKQLIINGSLKPGDRLPAERELASLLGTSRHSLREALRVLHALGILEIRPGSGTYVAESAEAALDESVFDSIDKKDHRFGILEARKIIEPGIAALAALRASNHNLATLESHVRTMEEQVREGVDYRAADLGFHIALVNATQNLVLIKTIGAMESLIVVMPPAKECSAVSHRRIFEAVRRRDSAAAYLAMEEHIVELEGQLMRDPDGKK